MSYRVREFDYTNREDAQRLADLFNAFDTSWPGGFLRGVTETAENVQQQFARARLLAALVVEHEGVFAGYCDLKSQGGVTDMAYIPLLGAHGDHHGRGVGKMLLREMIRRATEKGFREVTLDTWEGNMKAVPLYKKTGFHWVPDSHVSMRNFIPTALTIPIGKAFFANRDWYACHRRDLEVAPDNTTWNGMKVFVNRFEDGDDFLQLRFDAVSGGVTSVETPAFSLGCYLPVEEAAAGETYPITWEIAPANGRTLEVMVLAEPEPGFEMEVRERRTIDRPTTITRDLRIASGLRPRTEAELPYRLRTTLMVDGQLIALQTGIKVVRPVEIEFGGQGLFPGREEKIVVALSNNLERPVQGRLILGSHAALSCAAPVQEFQIPPRLKTQCTFAITAREAGTHQTQLTAEGEQIAVTRPAAFRALGSSVLASMDADYARHAVLETPGLRAQVELLGGSLSLHNSEGQLFCEQNIGEIGPPFTGWWLRAPLCPTTIEMHGAETTLVTRLVYPEQPELTLERRVTLLSGNLARIAHRIANASDQNRTTKVRVQTKAEDIEYLALPTTHGLLREFVRNRDIFPHGDMDVLSTGERFAENWVAAETDGRVVGLIWPGDPAPEFGWERLPALTYDVDEVPARSIVEGPTVYLLAGQGDWRAVREWWRRLVQLSGVVEERPPQVVPLLEVQAEPSPALLDTGTKVQLRVQNRRNNPLTGCLSLRGENALVEPGVFEFSGVQRATPYTAEVQITGLESPGAGVLNAVVDNGVSATSCAVPLIRLGTAGETRLSKAQAGVLVVENGVLTLRVAPAFQGALIALEHQGVNHLYSAYPEARSFLWTRPWFGGIHPCLDWIGNTQLARETFTGEAIERVGERGLRWKGVRVAVEPKHKERRWLKMEADYLTLPGSNVVAVVSRWINKSAARQAPHGGVAAWLQVGGNRQTTTVHWQQDGIRQSRRPGAFAAEVSHQAWAAVESPETRTALLMLPQRPAAYGYIEDYAEEGRHLGAYATVALEPCATRELLTWFVLTSDVAQVSRYAALSSLTALP
jgi:ribosomal protein S18 acetylase RimI-like enzyme